MTDELDETTAVFIPEQQDKIDFHGHIITTVTLKDGQGYVSLNSLAATFGLSRPALVRRVNRNSYYEPYVCRIRISTAGGPQVQVCLNANAVPLFLSGTSLEAISDPDSRALMESFIGECHAVLAEHFGVSERGEINVLRQTVAKLVAERDVEDGAEAEGVDLEPRAKSDYVDQRIAEMRSEYEEKVDEIRKAFSDLRKQVRVVSTAARERITPEQAHQINATVRALGYLMQQRGHDKPYPGIYADIFRMAGVGVTERICQADFEMVMEFLEKRITLIQNAPEMGGAGE